MRKRNRAAALALAATLVLAASATAAPEPGETVKVKSTITIAASGYQGKVRSANPDCLAERVVVLKQKGNGVLSRVKSKDNGGWQANLDEVKDNVDPPARVYAEVKPLTQATAGPIYRCLGAVSRTVTMAGA